MEEEKAAAYYAELSRKGGGAARFKQGLGFSSNDDVPSNPNKKLLFVKAGASESQVEKQGQQQQQLKCIQQKLSKSKSKSHHSSSSSSSSSNYRDRDRDRDTYRDRHRHRSRRKRSISPRDRDNNNKRRRRSNKDGIDYAKLIPGYHYMSPAERVKEKMKLQLSQTAKNDATNGKGPGWERFDFDKDAPLDDEDIEAADDDKELVKHIGQSFRFSTVETKNEEKLKAAHDEAMFGAPSLAPAINTDTEVEEEENKKENPASLISDQVLAMQQGSWRDRARKA